MVAAAVFLVMVVVVVITMIIAVRRKKIQTSELSVLAPGIGNSMYNDVHFSHCTFAITCIVLHCMQLKMFMQVCYCTEQQALFM